MSEAVVVVPVYKIVPDNNEIISFLQLLSVLKQHTICVVAPNSLNCDWYHSNAKKDIMIERFPDRYFLSKVAYSRLMISPAFYIRFRKYTYMLVHQLDALVFKDELHDWCCKGYDYIGAPWIGLEERCNIYYRQTLESKYSMVSLYRQIFDFNKGQKIFVGNGGFSLRKIRKFHILSILLPVVEPRIIRYGGHEDIVWSIYATKYFKNYHIPPLEEAVQFAFESNPDRCFSLTGGKLPFGCHGWLGEYKFWRPYVENLGYKK